MSYNLGPHPGSTRRLQILLAAALLILAWVIAMVSRAAAQRRKAPATPAMITPPPGNAAFLDGHAVGTQSYVCLPASTGVSWTASGSRPEATLFAGTTGHQVQIVNHYLSPDANPNEFAPRPLPFGSATWQSSVDSSKVWGQALNAIQAGSDSSCPNAGAISCLLLQSIGWEKGPNGGNIMGKTTFIQRLNTQGGSAPASGCSIATDVGKQAFVPYSADYYFFRRSNKSLGKKVTRFELLLLPR